MRLNSVKTTLCRGLLATLASVALLFTAAAQQKDAEPATRAANETFKSGLPPASESTSKMHAAASLRSSRRA